MSSLKLKPPGEMKDEELAEFVKQKLYRENPLYGEDVSRWRRAELYDQNEQVLQKSYAYSGAAHSSQWRKVRHDPYNAQDIFLPVFNEGVTARENESSRLGRPEYKPRVRAKGQNPDLKAKEGAQGAERALISRLKDMRWDVQADRAFWQMPGYGGCWLLSRWDQTWLDTVRVPAAALACPRHPVVSPPSPVALPSPPPEGAGLSDPSGIAAFESETVVNGELIDAQAGVMPLPGTCSYLVREMDHGGEKVCPHCPDHPALMAYEPTMEEAQSDLGQDLPKGDWFLTAEYPYGLFPRDCGLGVDPTDVDEWSHAHIETLDWVAARWPAKVRDEKGEERIKGESVAQLLVQNPTLGSPALLESAKSIGAYKEHVLVMEWHKKPWYCWNETTRRFARNRGRSMVVVNGIGCLDADMEIESFTKPGTYVNRVELEFVAWEFMDGGRRGTAGAGLWDRMFDAQDGINTRMGQVGAVNERGALPIALMDRNANMEMPAQQMAIPYRQVECQTDPGTTRPPIEIINNDTIAPGVYQEMDNYRGYMDRGSGNVEVERGQIPPGAGAATSIAYLKTEAGEKRRPRIARYRNALVRKWNHGLQLMAAMYIEPRSYNYKDDTGEEREAFITGDVIASANPQVDIYPAPDYDAKDLQRENVRDAIRLGALDPKASSRINRKVLRIFDDSLEIFVDDDLQEEQAQREWQMFKDQGRVPVVDPGIDQDVVHKEEHGRNIMSPWFRQQEEAAGWDGALEILGNQWDESLQQVGISAQGMSPQPLIKGMWQQKLQAAGYRPKDAEALEKVLSWRAHYEAHRLREIMAQVSAQPTAEAPGQGSAPALTNEAPMAPPEMVQ